MYSENADVVFLLTFWQKLHIAYSSAGTGRLDAQMKDAQMAGVLGTSMSNQKDTRLSNSCKNQSRQHGMLESKSRKDGFNEPGVLKAADLTWRDSK